MSIASGLGFNFPILSKAFQGMNVLRSYKGTPSLIKVKIGKSNIYDIIPRFNATEPFFDPMYPQGRLFYRRLMTCGDTTIVLNNRYRNGPRKNDNKGELWGGYNPAHYATFSKQNIFETVRCCNVKYEDDPGMNPFLQDGGARIEQGGGGSDFEVYTDTWPVAGGDVNTGLGGSNSPDHWNHVYNARYSVPWIMDNTGTAVAQVQHCCADAPWSVPFCVRDRFYEIRVRAEIIHSGLATDISKWRGVQIFASKQALAVFDRGWQWAYWDDRINEASPWYDPFKMVGSRPGVDCAWDPDNGKTLLDQSYEGLIFDNEMCHYNDWSVSQDSEGKIHYYDRRISKDRVPVGYIAPAEYCGVNRPGDDAPERARIVFFRWLGVNQ